MEKEIEFKVVVRRLYTYLDRFKTLDRLDIDVLYVMAKIFFDDTSKENRDYLKRIAFGGSR